MPFINQSINRWHLWLLAFRNVERQRARSFICITTIAGGVLSLLLFEAFNQGALWEYQERVVHTRVGHLQVTKKVAENVISRDVAESLFDDLDTWKAWAKKNTRVIGVFPRLRVSGLLTNGKKSLPVIAEGIDPAAENPFFDKLDYLSGASMTPGTPGNPGRADEVVIGEGVAKGLQLSVGSHLTLMANTLNGSLNAIDLTVAGTFRSGVKEFDESFIRMPLSAAQDLYQTSSVTQMNIGLKSSNDLKEAKADLMQRLPAGYELQDFVQLDDIYYGNSVRWLKAQFFFIRLIIYLVVIMGILNTVNITIHERTSEIGTLRAMGFGRNFVLKQFLREYFILGVAGVIVGVSLALLIKSLLFFGVPMPPSPGATKGLSVMLRLTPKDIALNAVVAILCSVLACYWPAKRAARMPIVEALGRRI